MDSAERTLFGAAGITHVVNCTAATVENAFADKGLKYLALPLDDIASQATPPTSPRLLLLYLLALCLFASRLFTSLPLCLFALCLFASLPLCLASLPLGSLPLFASWALQLLFQVLDVSPCMCSCGIKVDRSRTSCALCTMCSSSSMMPTPPGARCTCTAAKACHVGRRVALRTCTPACCHLSHMRHGSRSLEVQQAVACEPERAWHCDSQDVAREEVVRGMSCICSDMPWDR